MACSSQAAPVGYQYYLTQKAAQEAQVKLEKREKNFNKHERQFLKHIKQATASTEYVAQKYTATWETLIKMVLSQSVIQLIPIMKVQLLVKVGF